MKLSIQHLGKTYQDGKVALDDFNIELDRGVFGLLGPNGSGKSTLLEILSLNLMPTTGKLFWNGRDIQLRPKDFRRILGYLPQNYGFYGELKAGQFLDYMGRLFGLRGRQLRRQIDSCLEKVHLSDRRYAPIRSFSGGMRQRLGIAQALIASPEILVIDEPTTGLDPAERVAFRNMLFDIGAHCIVVLSTHIVKDVEFSCQSMTLLYAGRQRFTGQPAKFVEQVHGRVFEVEIPMADFERFSAEHSVIAIHERAKRVQVRYIAPEPSSDVARSRPIEPNLEDAYVDFVRARQREDHLVPAV